LNCSHFSLFWHNGIKILAWMLFSVIPLQISSKWVAKRMFFNLFGHSFQLLPSLEPCIDSNFSTILALPIPKIPYYFLEVFGNNRVVGLSLYSPTLNITGSSFWWSELEFGYWLVTEYPLRSSPTTLYVPHCPQICSILL